MKCAENERIHLAAHIFPVSRGCDGGWGGWMVHCLCQQTEPPVLATGTVSNIQKGTSGSRNRTHQSGKKMIG